MSQRIDKLRIQLWIIWQVVSAHLYLFVALWLFTLWIFVYVLSFNVFTTILFTDGLDVLGKINFFIDSLLLVFKNAGNPQTLSVIIFSLVASVNVLLIVVLLRKRGQITKQKGSIAGGVAVMIGSHCIACGTSLLAPLFTIFVTGGVFMSSESARNSMILTITINLIGILLVGRATLKMAYRDYYAVYASHE